MKMIIEYFTLFLFLLVFLWTGITYVLQNVEINNARSYEEAVIDHMENSNFASSVIETCKEQAQEAGYQLTVTDCTVYEMAPMKKVSLVYTYAVPLIGFEKEYVIEGYAG